MKPPLRWLDLKTTCQLTAAVVKNMTTGRSLQGAVIQRNLHVIVSHDLADTTASG